MDSNDLTGAWPHLLYAEQLTPMVMDVLIRKAEQFRRLFLHKRLGPWLAGKSFPRSHLVSIFTDEPSTRTKGTFFSAATLLGMTPVMIDLATTSLQKGESAADMARMCAAQMHRMIVIRSSDCDFVNRFAEASSVPVINAGNGRDHHPSQAGLDLYTVIRRHGRISGLRYALVGDLKNGRAPRSLALALANYPDISITFVAPDEMQMASDVNGHLTARGVSFAIAHDLAQAMQFADVVYMTRLQLERVQDPQAQDRLRAIYPTMRLTFDMLKSSPVKTILHPLPRLDELPCELDHDLRSAYFEQTENALYFRMALYWFILRKRYA